MKKILFINTCVRPESRTRMLAEALLKRLGGEITEVRPDLMNLKPLDRAALERRNEILDRDDLGAPELRLARNFAEADVIVIAAPYWDLAFPAWLKIYLENVTVCGVTFRYTDEGVPVGLCRAERLYYVATSGGPILQNLGFEYVNALAKCFYGISDTRFLSAEGLDIYGADVEKIMNDAIGRAGEI